MTTALTDSYNDILILYYDKSIDIIIFYILLKIFRYYDIINGPDTVMYMTSRLKLWH